MLGCDEKTAMLKMVRRLTVYLQSEIVDASKQTPSLVKRSEMTGFELSVVRGVDKVFKKQVLGDLPSTVAKLERQFIVIATKKGVIIEEKVAGKGSFKVATFASDYFSIKRPTDRIQFVTAKPHKLAADFSALATLKSKGKEKTLSGGGTGVVPGEASPSDSFIVHEEDEASPSDTFIVHEEDEASPSDTFIVHEDSPSSVGSLEEPVESKDLEEATPEIPAQDLHREMAVTPQGPPVKEVPLKQLTLGEMKELHKKIEEDLAGLDESSVEKRQALEKSKSELEAFMVKREKDIITWAEHKQMSEKEEYLYEIEITRELQGPGVVKMHSVIDLSSGEKIMIQEAAGFHLPATTGVRGYETTVVDLVKMFEVLSANQLTLAEVMKMMNMLEDAFRAVEGLHQKGYIHRDLKEQNILVTGDGHGRLTDFGTVAKQQGDSRKTVLTGTPHWMAPEVLRYCDSEKWDNLTEKCDIWSCGMILQSMISGGKVEDHPALGGLDRPMEVMFRLRGLKSEQYEKDYPKPDSVKDPLNHLIWWSTRFDPEERPTMSEFCQRFLEMKEQLEEEAKKEKGSR